MKFVDAAAGIAFRDLTHEVLTSHGLERKDGSFPTRAGDRTKSNYRGQVANLAGMHHDLAGIGWQHSYTDHATGSYFYEHPTHKHHGLRVSHPALSDDETTPVTASLN